MNFKQVKGRFYKSEVVIELQETGLQYSLADMNPATGPRVNSLFLSYYDVGANKIYTTRAQPFAAIVFNRIRIALWVLYAILFFSYINGLQINSQSIDIGMIITSVLILVTFLLFYYGGKQKIVQLKNLKGGQLTIFDDKQTDKILEEIFKHRDSYLRKRYLSNESRPYLRLENADYLRSMKVISDKEFVELKREIDEQEKNRAKARKIGFDDSDKLLVSE